MFANLFKVFTFLLSRNLDKSAEEYNIQFLYTPDQPEMESDRVAFLHFSINMVLGNWVSGYEVKVQTTATALSIKFQIFLKWKRTKESHFHDNSIWQFARTISLEFKMMPKPSGGLISPNLLPQLRSSPSPRYKSKIKIIFKFLQSLSLASFVANETIYRFS